MRIFTDPNRVQDYCLRISGEGETALVPTMGCLHEGHLSLIRWAAANSEFVVVSLFVNPAQFGPGEDLNSYPRTLDRDRELAEKEGADVLFVPETGLMYPPGFDTWVDVPGVSANLCGKSRPGHFRGVATVVLKLLNITCPDMAVFGRKDWQQLAVIRRMVQDLNLTVRIVGRPTVREPDGLALSSRNSYLTAGQREQAGYIYAGLLRLRERFAAGERETKPLIEDFYAHCRTNIPDGEVEYCRIVHPGEMTDMDYINGSALAAAAVRLG
ncbi:MAG: pantoate--beta-alanine ligase, partial [Desulfonatronovibrionaceae bacterium]